MELFQHDGHLTPQALAYLAQDGALPELERLEAAEHLAYCDQCLMRYTNLLSEEDLLTPSPVCRQRLWRRIRLGAVRLVTSRYATAAAAIAIAVFLWSGGIFGGVVDVSRQLAQRPMETARAETLWDWPEKWNEAVQTRFADLENILERLGKVPDGAEQGGWNT